MSKDYVMLSRNNFETYITGAVKNLRKDDKLCDVTLVCEDGEIRAHRFILSACSPFFRRVVGKTSYHVHPLLYLQGASTRILAKILDYIYLGMVHMPQEDLSDMLNLASVLKVCGLDNYLSTSLQKDLKNTGHYHEALSNEGGKDKEKIDPLKVSKSIADMKKLYSVGVAADIVEECEVEDGAAHIVEDGTAYSMEDGVNNTLTDNEVEDGSHEEEEYFSVLKLKEDEKKPSLNEINLEAPPHDDTNKDKMLDGMVDTIVIRTISKCGVSYECRVCKKTMKEKNLIRRHAETHIKGFSHKCHYCGKSYKTRDSLRVHMIVGHKGCKTEEVEDGHISQ